MQHHQLREDNGGGNYRLVTNNDKISVVFNIPTAYTLSLTLFLAASLRGWVLEAFLVLAKENVEKICFLFRYFFFRRAVCFLRDCYQ